MPRRRSRLLRDLAHTIHTATGEPEPVLREQPVRHIEKVRDARNPRECDERPESDRGIELPEYLHTLDERAVWQAPMNAFHQRLPGHADRRRVETRNRNVHEPDTTTAIQTLEHPCLPHTERALAIVEDLDIPGMMQCGHEYLLERVVIVTNDSSDFKFEKSVKPYYSLNMKVGEVLTTAQAAELAAVTPSTVKRWADQGLLPSIRTAGGHRRIERAALERFLRDQAHSGSARDLLVESWISCLASGLRHEIDGRLLEARARLGAWYRVADELGLVLVELGRLWECKQLTVAEEHLASDCLTRALARIGDTLPMNLTGPRCLLACAGDDDHTLGLALAELCLRELAWTPFWLGRRTPITEILRLIERSQLAMVALSASIASDDEKALGEIALRVGTACAARAVPLVLGGAGAWPVQLAQGVRLTSFDAFHDYLARTERPR